LQRSRAWPHGAQTALGDRSAERSLVYAYFAR
jgi:hypothetical protein